MQKARTGSTGLSGSKRRSKVGPGLPQNSDVGEDESGRPLINRQVEGGGVFPQMISAPILDDQFQITPEEAP